MIFNKIFKPKDDEEQEPKTSERLRKEKYQRLMNLKRSDNMTKEEQIEEYRSHLNFLARHSMNKTLKMYHDIGTSYNDVNIATNMLYIMIGFMSFVLFFISTFIAHTQITISLSLVLIVSAAIYYLFYLRLSNKYNEIIIETQKQFNKFTRKIISYVPDMQNGTHIYNILDKVRAEITDETTNHFLSQMMLEIMKNPKDSLPYLKFSTHMSATYTSDQFMGSLFDMAQGSFSTDTVDNLANEADDQLVELSQKIADSTINAMEGTYPVINYCIVGIILMFLIQTVLNMFTQTL